VKLKKLEEEKERPRREKEEIQRKYEEYSNRQPYYSKHEQVSTRMPGFLHRGPLLFKLLQPFLR
jgi:hypothetical protein